MLTPNLARTLLHRVNLQINSNTICIKDDPSLWNLPEQFKLYRQTNKNIKQLNKDDPTHKISKRNNLIQSFAMLYTKLREAIRDDDQPMLHRYLTNELYQQWKDKNKEAFNLYKTVYNIKLKQAQICQNEHGRWIQCLIRLKHEGEHKEHIVQRKLGLMPDAVRTWYFVRFQN